LKFTKDPRFGIF